MVEYFRRESRRVGREFFFTKLKKKSVGYLRRESRRVDREFFFIKLKQKNQWDTSGGRAGELAGNGSFFTAGGGDSHRHHFRYRNSIIIITTLKMINIIIIVKTSHLVGQAVGETQEPGLLPHTPAL